MRRWAIILALFLTAGLTAAGYGIALRNALQDEASRGQATLRLALDRLDARTERFRTLPFVITRFETLQAALDGSKIEDLSSVLSPIADASGAVRADLLDRQGQVVATSGGATIIVQDARARPSFERALDGALGQFYALDASTGARLISFEYPVQAEDGRILGVFALHVDVEELESSWRGDANIIFFTDTEQAGFISNRTEFAGQALPSFQVARRAGVPRAFEIWDGLPVSLGKGPFLHLEQLNLRTGLTGHVLKDLQLAYERAQIGALIGGLTGALASLIALVIWQRRQSLQARLALKEAAARTLEKRVQERTEDLQRANDQLTDEIAERSRLQAELVQAEKLAALGEMSAGISHELNQPLAAIRTLAENAEVFLDRGNDGTARKNMARIAEVSDRSGRILRNLRAFARKEHGPIVDVDLRSIVIEAVAMAQDRAQAAGVEIATELAQGSIVARGGRVRLEQVVFNLMTNAIDAMTENDSAEKRLTLSVHVEPQDLVLTVTDTGPGLTAPDRVFDPFYTTKPVGQGLGLGLSISYGMVQSFGGKLTARDNKTGGAAFELRLPRPNNQMEAAE